MADVFLSYAAEDRARVAPLVETLELQGWSVWWDREIRPGASWDDSIEAEVDAAGCVVVIWTRHSVGSRWVKNEALVGLEQGKLVPVLLDRVEVPIAFRGMQLADLTGWSSRRSETLSRFVAAVGEMLGRESGPVAARAAGRWREPALLALVGLAIALAFGIAAWRLEPGAGVSESGVAKQSLIDLSEPVPGFEGKPAIAVLPFRDLNPGADVVSLAEGLSHDIAHGLARFRGFPVISSMATQVYAGRNVNVAQVAREVGAGYVVTGDVRRTGDGFRVNAQMTDADGRTLWSQSFSGALDEFFEVQDRITERIVGTTWPQYLRAEKFRAQRSHPANLSAWQNFVQGWEMMFDARTVAEGEARCRRAIELDPTFALAYVCVGHAMGMQLIGSTAPDDVVTERLEEVFSYFERAREIDPFDSTACACMVYWLTVTGRLGEAQAEAEYGLTLNPSNHVLQRAYGMYLLARGREEKALEHMKRALRLNPQGPDTVDTYANLATAVLANGDVDRGVRYARQAVTQDPNHPAYQTLLVVALYLQGREEAARTALERAYERVPDLRPDTLWNRGWLKPLDGLMREQMSDGPELASASTGELLNRLFAELGYERAAAGDTA